MNHTHLISQEIQPCYGCQKENPCPNNHIYSFIDKSIIQEFSPVLFSFNLESNENGELIDVAECRYAMPDALKNYPALQYLHTADWERDMLPF